MLDPKTLISRRRQQLQAKVKDNNKNNLDGQTQTELRERRRGDPVQYLKAPRIVPVIKDVDHLFMQL